MRPPLPLVVFVVVDAGGGVDDAFVLGGGVVEVGGSVEPHEGHAVGDTEAEGGAGVEAPLAAVGVVEDAVGEEGSAEVDVFDDGLGLGAAFHEGFERGDESVEVGDVAVGVGDVLAAGGGGGDVGEESGKGAHLGVALHFRLDGIGVEGDEALLQARVEVGVDGAEGFDDFGVFLLLVADGGGAVHVFEELVGQAVGGELDGFGFLRLDGIGNWELEIKNYSDAGEEDIFLHGGVFLPFTLYNSKCKNTANPPHGEACGGKVINS